MKNLLKVFLLSLSTIFLFGCAKPVIEEAIVEEPLVIQENPIVETTPSINTDLQTYTNTDYGFEFQYPTENEPGNKFKVIETANNPDII
jgi:hypothetical protein